MGGFRKFLFRGNLIDLAVAVVIGIAFNAVIQALIADVITPLIAAIGGKPNFGSLSFTINKSHFLYGSFINALLSFVIIAAVVYFLIVDPGGQDDSSERAQEGSHRAGIARSASAASPSGPAGACTARRRCRRSSPAAAGPPS